MTQFSQPDACPLRIFRRQSHRHVGNFLIALLVGTLFSIVFPVRLQAAPGVYTPVSGVSNPLNGVTVGSNSALVFLDMDVEDTDGNGVLDRIFQDGDLDVFIGAGDGTLKYYKNTGTATAPVFTLQSNANTPKFLNSSGSPVTSFGTNSHPAFADWDNDGDPDAFIGLSNGTIRYFENLSVAGTDPIFQEFTGDLNPFSAINVTAAAAPTFSDYDLNACIDGKQPNGDNCTTQNDISQDLFIGRSDGSVNLMLDVGDGYNDDSFSTFNPFFVTGPPAGLIDFGTNSVPGFGDVDRDGDIDAIVGNSDGNIYYMVHFTTSWFYASLTSPVNPFRTIDVGTNASPVLVDIDDDGDQDLFVGTGAGTISYFRNDEIMPVTLTVVRDGVSGSITSDPAGIDCPGTSCTANYTNNTLITLAATPFFNASTPASNTVFTGWTVAGAPDLCVFVADCTFTLETSTTVTAHFATGLPQVNWTVASRTVPENFGQVTVIAALTLNGQPVTAQDNVTVPYTVTGTAQGGGVDHDLASGIITIPAGQTEAPISFTVTDDNVAEPADETIILTMGTVSTNSTKGSIPVETITIRDNDAGDLNGDNSITLKDAILALQVLAGIAPAETITSAGDINGNGLIDMGEVIFILQRVGGLR